MLQKRVDEKLQYYKDRQKRLPEMKEQLEKLKAKQATLQTQIYKVRSKIGTESKQKKVKVNEDISPGRVALLVPTLLTFYR
jgi:chromosome segregation ATPase